MDYIYNYKIDTSFKLSNLKKVCEKALQRARLKAPIKTGNLRKSIKFNIKLPNVILYIDKSMYDVPYYEYVNEAPRKDNSPRSGNQYWYEVVTEFGNILYANLDRAFKEELKKEKDEEARKKKLEEKNEEKKKRDEENRKLTEALKQLGFVLLLQQLGVQNERKKQQ